MSMNFPILNQIKPIIIKFIQGLQTIKVSADKYIIGGGTWERTITPPSLICLEANNSFTVTINLPRAINYVVVDMFINRYQPQFYTDFGDIQARINGKVVLDNFPVNNFTKQNYEIYSGKIDNTDKIVLQIIIQRGVLQFSDATIIYNTFKEFFSG